MAKLKWNRHRTCRWYLSRLAGKFVSKVSIAATFQHGIDVLTTHIERWREHMIFPTYTALILSRSCQFRSNYGNFSCIGKLRVVVSVVLHVEISTFIVHIHRRMYWFFQNDKKNFVLFYVSWECFACFRFGFCVMENGKIHCRASCTENSFINIVWSSLIEHCCW